MEIKSTTDYVLIEGFKFAKDELRCNTCGSNAQRINHRQQHEVEGVEALALGTECQDCGYTTLHISYPPVE